MQYLVRFFCAIVATMLSLPANTASSATPLQPTENFTKRPGLSDVSFFTSVNRMAFIMFNKESHCTVAVMDLNPFGAAKAVVSFADADVTGATEFLDAAKRAGVNVEQVACAEEGHGFFDPEDAADDCARLEKFFANSLQAAP
jgi:hypothetical protein